MSPPPSRTMRSLAGLASTATQRPSAVPATSTTSASMSSWTQSSSGRSRGSARSTRPLAASASSRVEMASKRTIQPFWCVLAASTRMGPRSLWSTAPGSRRSSRLVDSLTKTSPFKPCGLVICPISSRRSVNDVDGRLDALRGAGGPHDGADGLGHPAPPPDDLAHVVGRHMEGEHHATPPLADVDLNGVGLVDDGLCQELQHLARGGTDDPIEVVVLILLVVVFVI